MVFRRLIKHMKHKTELGDIDMAAYAEAIGNLKDSQRKS